MLTSTWGPVPACGRGRYIGQGGDAPKAATRTGAEDFKGTDAEILRNYAKCSVFWLLGASSAPVPLRQRHPSRTRGNPK